MITGSDLTESEKAIAIAKEYREALLVIVHLTIY